ncbi:MAG: hypothetical protein AAGC71_03570 [Pseudomonadota bacterium]
MKTLIGFLIGTLLGLALVAAAVWYNPLDRGAIDVPIDNNERTLHLQYDSPLHGSIFYTNSGVEGLPRNPVTLKPLPFRAQRFAHVGVFTLSNRRGEPVAIGIKHLALAESTRLLPAIAPANSVWQVVVPGAGSFFVDSVENYWPFLHDVLLPAVAADDGRWRGRFEGDTTIGPKGTLEAVMTGATGLFRDRNGLAKERLQLDAFSTQAGEAASSAFATLTIVPDPVDVPAIADDATAGAVETVATPATP